MRRSRERSPRVIVIDDDPSVREVSRAYLERDGFVVTLAETAQEGIKLAERVAPDLVVLDLMLPDLPGEDVAREIRGRSDLPILILTAKASESDRLNGLALGADDYLVKPFSPRELVARVRAILRRTNGVDAPLVSELRLGGGNLVINSLTREVIVRGSVVDLTRNEYRLLEVLARYPGRVYSRLELINRVQGYDYEGYERTIDAHVKNLRKKIEVDARHPEFVETVFGSGYRMARPARAS